MIIGTPAALSTLLDDHGSGPLSGLCALIIDDVDNILGDQALKVSFMNVIQQIYKIHDNPSESHC